MHLYMGELSCEHATTSSSIHTTMQVDVCVNAARTGLAGYRGTVYMITRQLPHGLITSGISTAAVCATCVNCSNN